VHDPGPVQRGERVGDAAGQHPQGVVVQRPGLGDQVVQPPAGHEAGDQVGQVGVDVGVEHLDQVRPAHPAEHLELVPEAPPGVRVTGPDSGLSRSTLTATARSSGETPR
jgi:hypothetical protein